MTDEDLQGALHKDATKLDVYLIVSDFQLEQKKKMKKKKKKKKVI